MNKKGSGLIGAIILFMMFLIIWFIWLGKWIGDAGQLIVTANSLTGIEAFFISNLNLVVLVCMFLGMLGFMYLSSG